MMSKITKWLASAAGKIPAVRFAGNTWIVYLAILLLFGSLNLYIGAWCWLTFWERTGTLAELKEIIVVLCGAPFIAALCSLRVGILDRDKDGVTDADEQKEEEKE